MVEHADRGAETEHAKVSMKRYAVVYRSENDTVLVRVMFAVNMKEALEKVLEELSGEESFLIHSITYIDSL